MNNADNWFSRNLQLKFIFYYDRYNNYIGKYIKNNFIIYLLLIYFSDRTFQGLVDLNFLLL